MTYFFPPLAAFFASISCFTASRFGDLYGRLDVFLFGLNAIIRVMVLICLNLYWLRRQDSVTNNFLSENFLDPASLINIAAAFKS